MATIVNSTSRPPGSTDGNACSISCRVERQTAPGRTRVLYSQAAGVPAGLLDSNVVLDAGDGNRAVGRCTLDLATRLGLCTFSDGTGQLAGFQARVDVSYVSGFDWDWNGTYSFDRD